MSLGNEQIKNGTQYNKTDKRQPELATNTLTLSHYSGEKQSLQDLFKGPQDWSYSTAEGEQRT